MTSIATHARWVNSFKPSTPARRACALFGQQRYRNRATAGDMMSSVRTLFTGGYRPSAGFTGSHAPYARLGMSVGGSPCVSARYTRTDRSRMILCGLSRPNRW